MRIEVDSGQLDELEQEVASLKRVLSGDYGDTGDLISAAQALMEEVDAVLDCAEDTSDWERKLEDDDEEDE